MKLASVIIPCYNADRWVAEAVESCLAQTYQSVEVIVIDDGSTDRSLAILQSYGQRIRLLSGPNRGGNHARNQGIRFSKGDYVQFLDADDYLLPEKIERQIGFLEETGADAVFGDWRHQFHEPDGRVWKDEVHTSGDQRDVLASLLSGWWVPNNAILWRHEAVIASGGWDPESHAGQDRDFFLSIALQGADIRYQPGCYSTYRRYGAITVSTANRLRWLESHQSILAKAEQRLVAEGRLTAHYRRAIAQSYFQVARNFYDIDRQRYRSLMNTVLRLDPEFSPQESPVYNWACRLMGFEKAEQLAVIRRKFRPQHY